MHVSGTARIQTEGPKHFLQAILLTVSGRNMIWQHSGDLINLVSILLESDLEPVSSGEICSQQQGFLWRSFP